MTAAHEWPAEQVQRLCDMLAASATRRAIGEELGITRNAVIGKIKRMSAAGDPRLPDERRRVGGPLKDTPQPRQPYRPGSSPRRALAPQRSAGRAGQAAEHLRRFGPVWRCNASGYPDARGTHWRRGSAVLSDEELIARAMRHGFDPDGWRSLTPTSLTDITTGASA